MPELALFGGGVNHDGPARAVEAHHRPLARIVGRPSGRPTGGERDPGAVHCIGQRLWRVVAGQGHRAFPPEIVEDESDLQGMDRSEPTVEERRAPGELIEVGRPAVPGMGFREPDRRDTKKPIGDQRAEQVARRCMRSGRAVHRQRLANIEPH